MNKELPEQIYFKRDIDKAFDMGLETAVSVFEKSLGMTVDNQKLILDKLKEMLSEIKMKQL